MNERLQELITKPILTHEELEEIEEMEEVIEVEFNGMSGQKIGCKWYSIKIKGFWKHELYIK